MYLQRSTGDCNRLTARSRHALACPVSQPATRAKLQLFRRKSREQIDEKPATPSARLDRFRSLIRRIVVSRAVCRQVVGPQTLV
jgi:hypothetical protein